MISGKIMTTGILMTVFVAGINPLTFVEPTTHLLNVVGGAPKQNVERIKQKHTEINPRLYKKKMLNHG